MLYSYVGEDGSHEGLVDFVVWSFSRDGAFLTLLLVNSQFFNILILAMTNRVRIAWPLLHRHTSQKGKENVSHRSQSLEKQVSRELKIRTTQGLGTYIVMSVASVGVAVAVTVVVMFVVSFVDYSVLTGR